MLFALCTTPEISPNNKPKSNKKALYIKMIRYFTDNPDRTRIYL